MGLGLKILWILRSNSYISDLILKVLVFKLHLYTIRKESLCQTESLKNDNNQ